MMKNERQPISLQDLKARQSLLSRVIQQREALPYRLVPEGKGPYHLKTEKGLFAISHENVHEGPALETDILIALAQKRQRIDEKVRTHTETKLKPRLAAVTEEIAVFEKQNENELIEYAKQHNYFIHLRREQLTEIAGYADKGYYRDNGRDYGPEAVRIATKLLADLETLEKTDLRLQRGLAILDQRKEQEKAAEAQAATSPLEQPSKPEEKEKQLPMLTINKDTREVEISLWGKTKRKVFKSDSQWAVFMHLAQHTKEPVFWKTIDDIAKEAGYKGMFASGQTIRSIRNLIDENPHDPDILKRFGKVNSPSYSLLADIVFTDEIEKAIQKEELRKLKSIKTKESFQMFPVQLPDGQIIEVQGAVNAKTLGALTQATRDKKPIQTDELSIAVYGNYNGPKSSVVVRAALKTLQPYLDPHGLKIQQAVDEKDLRAGKLGKYVLEKIAQEKEGVQQPPAGQEQPPAPTTEEWVMPSETTEESARTQAPRLTDEPIVVPYEPAEEEKRSDEETKILEAVTDLLPRIRFEDLQRKIHSDERQRKFGNQTYYYPYSLLEIKQLFESSFTKIREEASAPHLKEIWDENERHLWEMLQSRIHQLTNGDQAEFLRKVKAELDRSQRQFHRDFPPQNREGVLYIRL